MSVDNLITIFVFCLQNSNFGKILLVWYGLYGTVEIAAEGGPDPLLPSLI